MNKGFTLIEIIVVLIILGVLATVALSSYFGWIERSRAAEALMGIKTIKDQIEACVAANGYSSSTYDKCFEGIVNAQSTAGNFTYAKGINDTPEIFFANGTYSILALRQQNGEAIPNDPCWDGCPIIIICNAIVPRGTAYQSGIQYCQNNATGEKKFKGWGTYEGEY